MNSTVKRFEALFEENQTVVLVVHSCSEASVRWHRGKAVARMWISDVLSHWDGATGNRFMIGEPASVMDECSQENIRAHREAENEGTLVPHSGFMEDEHVNYDLAGAVDRVTKLPNFPPPPATILVTGAWGDEEHGCAAFAMQRLQEAGYSVFMDGVVCVEEVEEDGYDMRVGS